MKGKASSLKASVLTGAAFMVSLVLVFPAWAHFHTYWPQVEGCYGKPGEAVRWRYFWGHPFEMAMDDAEPPRFFIFTPQGKKEPVHAKEITLQDASSGKARKAFEVDYKPAGPGDYYLCLEAVPIFIPEEKVFWQDYVKAPWHVGAEKGWDKAVGLEMEIVPLTRPYGWPGGSVFKGKALNKGRPLKTALVEIEKFHGFPVAKDKLPKDRHGEENAPLITRTAKTDLMGYFVCTLDSPGWWIISVATEGGKKVREGKPYPVEKRGCLWVYVEPAPAPLSPPGK